MAFNGFKDLRVWQKSHDFVIQVYKVTGSFPSEEKYNLTSQLRRAAVSVPSNIVEGYRKSKKDFLRFVDIAMGSLEESKYQILLSKDLGFLDNHNYDDLEKQADEIGKMLQGLKKHINSKLISG